MRRLFLTFAPSQIPHTSLRKNMKTYPNNPQERTHPVLTKILLSWGMSPSRIAPYPTLIVFSQVHIQAVLSQLSRILALDMVLVLNIVPCALCIFLAYCHLLLHHKPRGMICLILHYISRE